MKTAILLLTTLSLLSVSCGGGGASPSKLANEVCDCYKKANGMDAADPKRADAQNACITKQGENWNKIKDDPDKAKEYNKIIGDCGSELIKNSMPK